MIEIIYAAMYKNIWYCQKLTIHIYFWNNKLTEVVVVEIKLFDDIKNMYDHM